MTASEVVRAAVWILGVPTILFLLWRIVQRSREINKRIAEVRAEEAEIARNPYAAYARMVEAEQLLEETRTKKKRLPDP